MTEEVGQGVGQGKEGGTGEGGRGGNQADTPRKSGFTLIVSFASQIQDDTSDSIESGKNVEFSPSNETNAKITYSSPVKPRNLLPIAQSFPASPRSSLVFDTKSADFTEAEKEILRLSVSETPNYRSNGKFSGKNGNFGELAEAVTQKITKNTVIQLSSKSEQNISVLRRKSLQNLPSELQSALKFRILDEKHDENRVIITSFMQKHKNFSGLTQINQYFIQKLLFSGVYTKIYEAESNGLSFSIKEFNKNKMKISFLAQKRSGNRVIDREIEMLLIAKHKNVTELHEIIASQESSKVYLVTDFCPFSLSSLSPQSELSIKPLFSQLFSLLSHLHSTLHLYTSSISLSTLQTSPNGLLKLTDLSCARYSWEKGGKGGWGGRYYVSPEVGKGEKEGFESDIWAAGVCLYWGVVGKPPFQGDTVGEIKKTIEGCDFEVQTGFSDEFRSLLNGLLAKNPKNRLTATEALQHRWFQL